MEEIIKGHKYHLNNLKGSGNEVLNFYMDSEIHNGATQAGTSCQEVIRALIARVKALNEEKPHSVNEKIISNLRECIVLFEMRALLNKVKDGFEVENIAILPDGHIGFINDEQVLNALDLVHFYIDASDRELSDIGITRELVLTKAREAREIIDPLQKRGLVERFKIDYLKSSED
jgi:hypothetical protein